MTQDNTNLPEEPQGEEETEEELQRIGRPPSARFRREPMRPDAMREPMRSEAPHGRLKRTRKRTEDKFHIDPRVIPDGMSYEWKRESCYGMTDVNHQLNLKDNHWSAVPASRHPNMMPDGSTGAIRRDGLVLMERPRYLTEDARQEDYMLAVERVQSIEAQMGSTPSGTLTRDHPSVRRNTKLNKSWEPGGIPE